MFNFKKCISINELCEIRDKVVVVIMTGDYRPIQKQLYELGIENYNFKDYYSNVFDKKYSQEWFRLNLKNAINVLELFEDDRSKEVYSTLILNRIAPHLSDKICDDIKERKTEGKYYYNENLYYNNSVFKVTRNEILVDAGAFEGESIVEFLRETNESFSKIYAFEPNRISYDKMVKNLDKYKNKIEFINKGVWKHKDILSFDDKLDMSSHICKCNENTNNKIEVVSIDEAVKNNRVTFIKMDIEGAEIYALDGSKNVIKTYKPKLAISAYHYLSDLWNVPKKIKEICPEYKIYLRHHSPMFWDTNCYAYVY